MWAQEFHWVEGRIRGEYWVGLDRPTSIPNAVSAFNNEGRVAMGNKGIHLSEGEGGLIGRAKNEQWPPLVRILSQG